MVYTMAMFWMILWMKVLIRIVGIVVGFHDQIYNYGRTVIVYAKSIELMRSSPWKHREICSTRFLEERSSQETFVSVSTGTCRSGSPSDKCMSIPLHEYGKIW